MSNTKHLCNADFNGHPLLQQNFEEIKKGRGVTKLIGELDKAGKNVKTANGWMPVKGNEHLINKHQTKLANEGVGIDSRNESEKPTPNLAPTVTEAKHAEVHPDIKEAIEHYKGGTIPSEVLIHLATKYASEQPTEVFDSVHGAKIRVYGKEGNNYAINFGGAKGITLATEADMNTMRGKKKEVVTEIDEKQNKQKELNQLLEYRNKQDIGSAEYNKHSERITNLKNELVSLSEKPTLQLSGTDGNVFSIIGKVSGALKKAGQADKAKEFTERAFKAGSYDEVLQMVHQYVNAK